MANTTGQKVNTKTGNVHATDQNGIGNDAHAKTENTAQVDLDNLLADIEVAIAYGQSTLDSALGYEYKSGARKSIKAIAESHASLIGYRESVTLDNVSETAIAVESTLSSIDSDYETVKSCKATESERAALNVLHGTGFLLVNGEEYLIPSEGIAIVRYVRQTQSGNLSVLFMSPTQGSALLPIGLITPDTVKRFQDVRLTPEIQKAIAMAKGKFCEAFKSAVKSEKLSQKEQDNARRFSNAGFNRI